MTAHATLSDALSAACAAMRDPAKNAENPHFRSKFADLSAYTGVVRPALAAHGLSYSQGFTARDGGLWFATTIRRAAEVIEAGALPVATKIPEDPQKLGSLVTYLRRYSLAAAFGLAAEDDDANAAEAPAPPAKQRKAAPAAEPPPVAAEENGESFLVREAKAVLRALPREHGKQVVEMACDLAGIPRSSSAEAFAGLNGPGFARTLTDALAATGGDATLIHQQLKDALENR